MKKYNLRRNCESKAGSGEIEIVVCFCGEDPFEKVGGNKTAALIVHREKKKEFLITIVLYNPPHTIV